MVGPTLGGRSEPGGTWFDSPSRGWLFFHKADGKNKFGGPCWGRFGMVWVSAWGNFGVIWGLCWSHFGVILGSCGNRFGIVLELCWDDFGTVSEIICV